MKNAREKILLQRSASRRTMAERLRRSACLLNATLYEQAIAELDAGDQCLKDALRTYLNESLFQSIKPGESLPEIDTLRDKIAQDSEDPDLHFQLGVLLMDLGESEEAELRFAQVVSISSNHAAALVGLACVHHLHEDFGPAVSYLQRAQALNPHDARHTLFLALAAKAAHDKKAPVDVCVTIANDGRSPA